MRCWAIQPQLDPWPCMFRGLKKSTIPYRIARGETPCLRLFFLICCKILDEKHLLFKNNKGGSWMGLPTRQWPKTYRQGNKGAAKDEAFKGGGATQSVFGPRLNGKAVEGAKAWSFSAAEDRANPPCCSTLLTSTGVLPRFKHLLHSRNAHFITFILCFLCILTALLLA